MVLRLSHWDMRWERDMSYIRMSECNLRNWWKVVGREGSGGLVLEVSGLVEN